MAKHKWPEGKEPFPDGVNFVASELGVWSGTEWVGSLAEGKFYRPCTTEVKDGIAEAYRLTGVKGYLYYLQPPS